MRSLRRILAVAKKEQKILVRDRFYLFMAIALPVLTMVILGYGINYDVRGLPLGIADLDQSPESRQFVDAFTTSGYFRLAMSTQQSAALDRALDAGGIRVAVVIPSGFSQALHRGRLAEAQVLVDGSFSTRADIARGYVKVIVARFNQEHLEGLAQRLPELSGTIMPRLDVVSRVWFNPSLESKNFVVTGMLVVGLLFWTPVLISLSVTREKETGSILNVQTAPLARWEYVAGKLIPYAGISFIGYWLLLITSVALFQVPLKGSVIVLTLGGLLYVVGMSGLGLLVSMLVRTQVAALLVTSTIVMSIGIFYSGWLQPIAMLESRGRALSRLLPTADFMTLARGVYLKGLGFSAYRGALLTLAIYAAVFTGLSVLAFQKRRK